MIKTTITHFKSAAKRPSTIRQRVCSSCGRSFSRAHAAARKPCPNCGKPWPYSVTLFDNSC